MSPNAICISSGPATAIAHARLLARPLVVKPLFGSQGNGISRALTPDDYGDGDVSIGVRETVEAGRMLHDEMLNNVFEHVTPRLQRDTERAMAVLRVEGYAPHLCGAGPSFFMLYGGGADHADLLARRIRETGFEPMPVHAVGRGESLRMEEL